MAHTSPVEELARSAAARYTAALERLVIVALEHDCGVLVEWDVSTGYWQMHVDQSIDPRTIVERRISRREMLHSGRALRSTFSESSLPF